ncbi:MAG: DUF1569 domain-containing protein [Bacteroidetes bacterium]|nr:DUF1569 domain-containing protein [Bacteroidota bacterium]
MKSIYNPETLKEVISRIEKLTPETKAKWGKMNAAQMLAHCVEPLIIATGKVNEPRMLIGRMLAPFIKKNYYNDKPWQQNSPTAPAFIMTGMDKDFEKEKTNLIAIMTEFSQGGEEKCTKHPNPFWGKLTAEQNGLGQYKHLDHHLQQFGV